MLFTLYGDYLLRRTEPVWAGSLVTILGTLGMKPMAVRTTLSRMTAKGWLAVERRGARSYYGLTARGRRLLEQGRERIYHPPLAEPWDGSWFLITYSIPESRRHLRDSLRMKLLWLGCGMVGNGLWMSPHDVRRELAEIASSLDITKHVEVFRARHVSGSSARTLIARCWDLDALNARYAAFLRRWRPLAEHCDACRGLGHGAQRSARGSALLACQAPAECFVKRFTLVHEYRTFPLEDPYLPAALLPSDWHGREAAALFERYHRVLSAPAERYVREVCDLGAAAAPQRALQAAV
jgi:phenylacetic acid degradation operon negative regulatory protein